MLHVNLMGLIASARGYGCALCWVADRSLLPTLSARVLIHPIHHELPDGTGEIDARFLQDALVCLGLCTSLTEARRVMKEVDVDGSGTVSYPEMRDVILGTRTRAVGACLATPSSQAVCPPQLHRACTHLLHVYVALHVLVVVTGIGGGGWRGRPLPGHRGVPA
jgi:hypothetical protein